MLTIEAPAVNECVRLIENEYRELPALHMTKPQIRRRWGLDACTCDAAIEALVEMHVLKAQCGQYVRDDFTSEWSTCD